MKIEYKNIIPSPIENTTIKLMTADGYERGYTIKANTGYKLHDTACDCYFDIDGNELETPIKGFCNSASCGKNYDFTANPREFYTISKDNN